MAAADDVGIRAPSFASLMQDLGVDSVEANRPALPSAEDNPEAKRARLDGHPPINELFVISSAEPSRGRTPSASAGPAALDQQQLLQQWIAISMQNQRSMLEGIQGLTVAIAGMMRSPAVSLPVQSTPAQAGGAPGAQTATAAGADTASAQGLLASDVPMSLTEQKKLSSEIHKHLDGIAKTYEKTITKYMRSRNQVKKLGDDLDFLAAPENNFKYPPGTRPFKSPVEFAQLDEVLAETATGPVVFEVRMARGTSRREALAQLHFQNTCWQKKIHLEAATEYHEVLTAAAKKQTYLDACNSWPDVAARSDDGLDDPIAREHNRTLAREVVEKNFKKIVDGARAKWDATEKQKEEEKKKREETDKALLARNPGNLLRELVQSEVTRAVHVEDDQMGEEEPRENQKDKAQAFVESVRPEAKTKAKAKAKAKTKSAASPAPKAKSKGAGAPPARAGGGKGKGGKQERGQEQGKGKGKGQNQGAQQWGNGQAQRTGSGTQANTGRASHLYRWSSAGAGDDWNAQQGYRWADRQQWNRGARGGH